MTCVIPMGQSAPVLNWIDPATSPEANLIPKPLTDPATMRSVIHERNQMRMHHERQGAEALERAIGMPQEREEQLLLRDGIFETIQQAHHHRERYQVALNKQGLAFNLAGANLANGSWKDQDLSYARLSYVDAQNCDFSHACMVQTMLNGADVRGANFYGADLTNAHLDGIQGLRWAQATHQTHSQPWEQPFSRDDCIIGTVVNGKIEMHDSAPDVSHLRTAYPHLSDETILEFQERHLRAHEYVRGKLGAVDAREAIDTRQRPVSQTANMKEVLSAWGSPTTAEEAHTPDIPIMVRDRPYAATIRSGDRIHWVAGHPIAQDTLTHVLDQSGHRTSYGYQTELEEVTRAVLRAWGERNQHWYHPVQGGH